MHATPRHEHEDKKMSVKEEISEIEISTIQVISFYIKTRGIQKCPSGKCLRHCSRSQCGRPDYQITWLLDWALIAPYPVRLSTAVLDNYEIIFVMYVANIAFHSVIRFLFERMVVCFVFVVVYQKKVSNFGS